ncbi:hypothetical protein M2302_001941 [Micromonospora sp. A200]|uniref:hypothetical protein n=1 Tax=Micromonospora sp. A200 TaxID=2940568 RepID=UPI0024771319|nr:hypothetical protein [Micromonospora sp. A200]MDH6461766.1 hypothetical protein [Micromonospora sp. A200]
MTVRRGDRLVWEHPLWPVPLHLTVVRVARDGTWCDLDVRMCDAQWPKRVQLPLPSRCRPDNSTGE